MADTQILAQQVQATPGDYSPPAGQVITIGAVFAHYDGSGAAGSYVPTLDIVSDAGKTILSVVQDSTVAAGTSVESSWAPFLEARAAAAAGGLTVQWASARLRSPNNVGLLNGTIGFANEFATNDASVFAIAGTPGGFDGGAYIQGPGVGWYRFLFVGSFAPGSYERFLRVAAWDTTTPGISYVDVGPSSEHDPAAWYNSDDYMPTHDGMAIHAVWSVDMDFGPPAPAHVYFWIKLFNGDVANHRVAGRMTIQYLGEAV